MASKKLGNVNFTGVDTRFSRRHPRVGIGPIYFEFILRYLDPYFIPWVLFHVFFSFSPIFIFISVFDRRKSTAVDSTIRRSSRLRVMWGQALRFLFSYMRSLDLSGDYPSGLFQGDVLASPSGVGGDLNLLQHFSFLL